MENLGLSFLEFEGFLEKSLVTELPVSVWESMTLCIQDELLKSAEEIKDGLKEGLSLAVLDQEYLFESEEELFGHFEILDMRLGTFPQPKFITVDWYELFGGRDVGEIPEWTFSLSFKITGARTASIDLFCIQCGWTCTNGDGHTTCEDGTCTSNWSGEYKIQELSEFVSTIALNFFNSHLSKHVLDS